MKRETVKYYTFCILILAVTVSLFILIIFIQPKVKEEEEEEEEEVEYKIVNEIDIKSEDPLKFKIELANNFISQKEKQHEMNISITDSCKKTIRDYRIKNISEVELGYFNESDRSKELLDFYYRYGELNYIAGLYLCSLKEKRIIVRNNSITKFGKRKKIYYFYKKTLRSWWDKALFDVEDKFVNCSVKCKPTNNIKQADILTMEYLDYGSYGDVFLKKSGITKENNFNAGLKNKVRVMISLEPWIQGPHYEKALLKSMFYKSIDIISTYNSEFSEVPVYYVPLDFFVKYNFLEWYSYSYLKDGYKEKLMKNILKKDNKNLAIHFITRASSRVDSIHYHRSVYLNMLTEYIKVLGMGKWGGKYKGNPAKCKSKFKCKRCGWVLEHARCAGHYKFILAFENNIGKYNF